MLRDELLLCSPGWPGIYYVALIGLELAVFLHSPLQYSEGWDCALHCHTQLHFQVLQEGHVTQHLLDITLIAWLMSLS